MNEPVLIVTLIALVVLELFWILGQRRQVSRYRALSRSIRKEKEAAITLMDRIGERLTRRVDLDETLEAIAQYVVKATGAESGAVYLCHDAGDDLEARVVVGPFPPLYEEREGDAPAEPSIERIRARRIPLGEGIIGEVARSERPLLVTDAEADPRVPRRAAGRFQVRSLVLCPLRARSRCLGVLVIVNKRGGASFDSGDTFLLQALADQAAVAVDLVKLYDLMAAQQRMDQELKIAQEFQQMLMPSKLPEIDGYQFGATCRAALNVGGDFYDFFEVEPGRMGIAIGDVSGKGIPGALIMAMVRSVLRAEARGSRSPREVLRRVNHRVLADTKDSVFVTMTYGILDLERRRLRFARAGHEPTLLWRADGGLRVDVLQPEGMAVGLMPGEIFDRIEEEEVELHPGDSILLYTDGATEALNGDDEEYGRERLIEMFRKNVDRAPGELLDRLCEDIGEFTRDIPQHDDITLVAIRVGERISAGAGGRSEAQPPLRQTA